MLALLAPHVRSFIVRPAQAAGMAISYLIRKAKQTLYQLPLVPKICDLL